MKVATIAVLADTHGLLRQEVLDVLSPAPDAILHAGDINNQGILSTLGAIAPVYVVRGNNDREWAESLPQALDFALAGIRISMAHKKRDLPEDLSGCDLAVCGHTHRYEESKIGRTILLNPGSCGPRRFNQPITMAMVTVYRSGSGRRIDVKRIDIPNQPTRKIRIGADLKSQIEIVIRETQRGRTALEIASRRGWDVSLVEQIARLYATHPGVTADGIMAKMGI